MTMHEIVSVDAGLRPIEQWADPEMPFCIIGYRTALLAINYPVGTTGSTSEGRHEVCVWQAVPCCGIEEMR